MNLSDLIKKAAKNNHNSSLRREIRQNLNPEYEKSVTNPIVTGAGASAGAFLTHLELKERNPTEYLVGAKGIEKVLGKALPAARKISAYATPVFLAGGLYKGYKNYQHNRAQLKTAFNERFKK